MTGDFEVLEKEAVAPSLMCANTPRFDASLTNAGWGAGQEGYYGARGFADNLVDQLERVLGAGAESDQRHVRSFAGGRGADVSDVDLAGDHILTEGDNDRGYEREAVLALVGDQDPEVLGLMVAGDRFRKNILPETPTF